MRFIFNSFYIFLFLCLIRVSVSQDVCANVTASGECGQGTCVVDIISVVGYNCVCDDGWKQFQLGIITFPPCVIPNCTVNNDCGNGAPSPPPPPPPPPPFQLPSPANLTGPCGLVWCNDGSCVANGTGHYCQCNAGSGNLLNSTVLPCYKPCAFGTDCSVGIVPYVTPPPPGTLAPPPPATTTTNGTPPPLTTTPPPPLPNGSNNTSKCSRRYALSMSLLAAIFLAVLPSIVS